MKNCNLLFGFIFLMVIMNVMCNHNNQNVNNNFQKKKSAHRTLLRKYSLKSKATHDNRENNNNNNIDKITQTSGGAVASFANSSPSFIENREASSSTLSSSSSFQDKLCVEDENRFALFPIKSPSIWNMYKQAIASFWTVEEVDLELDKYDWQNKLNDNEKSFISTILAFFSGADGIVIENLAQRFCGEVQLPEARWRQQGLTKAPKKPKTNIIFYFLI